MPESIRPTLSGPESPGRHRVWARKKTLAASLAMAAAAGTLGLMQMSQASAATLLTVQVTVNTADADNQDAGRDKALALCQSNRPDTRSVAFDHSELYGAPGNPDPVYAAQVWNCLDTP